ncbi:hypothetical protein GA0115254_109522 [Streptomyces sp. Ncost-T10-10d]|nr:hypothetical protein GA0115254_109522 [Streptomyces sp. Ncost-T10-10d]
MLGLPAPQTTTIATEEVRPVVKMVRPSAGTAAAGAGTRMRSRTESIRGTSPRCPGVMSNGSGRHLPSPTRWISVPGPPRSRSRASSVRCREGRARLPGIRSGRLRAPAARCWSLHAAHPQVSKARMPGCRGFAGRTTRLGVEPLTFLRPGRTEGFPVRSASRAPSGSDRDRRPAHRFRLPDAWRFREGVKCLVRHEDLDHQQVQHRRPGTSAAAPMRASRSGSPRSATSPRPATSTRAHCQFSYTKRCDSRKQFASFMPYRT